jgi:outer membrane receptor protein involved in Fe transport
VRSALLTGAAVAAAGFASTASAAKANTPAQLGKVTVTGTRIKRSSIETAQPITRISRQQIEKSGYTSIGQFLGRLSFAGAHASTQSFSINTTINLRNLGSKRTLVLLNGKRWISGIGGITNLNTIPTSIIDHIEILQDGASAVYGSDAIAGVVNIITVKNFNGAEAHAYYGIHNGDGHWDGQIKQYDFTIGSGNNRGNVVFNATYREQNAIPRSHRALERDSIAGVTPGNIGGATSTPRGRFQLFGSAVSDRRFGQATCSTYSPARPLKTLCDMTLINAPAPPSLQNFKNWQPSDAYNRAQTLYNQIQAKNVSLYVQGHYDLFDNVTFTANAAFVRNENPQDYGPDHRPLGITSNDKANGQYFGISKTNPYNPFGVDLVSSTTDPCLAAGTCIGISKIDRGISESKGFDIHTQDNFHIFAGFNGYINLLDREIDWNVGFAQNRKQALRRSPTGDYNSAKLAKAFGPISQCTSPCVPLNYFSGAVLNGPGSITPAQLNYIGFENHGITQSNLRDWTANLSSNVYDLPAGPLGVAVGYERLDSYGYFHADAVTAAGNDYDSHRPNTNGRIVRDAEYAELNIPLLADLPGVKNLSVDIANRWTQFKLSGGETGQNTTTFLHNTSGRLNIRYQVISDLLLRASWSQGFRSPNISELFSGTSTTFDTFTDPCADGQYGGYQGGSLPPNCPSGTEDVQPVHGINDHSGGNAHLTPEKSLSRTVGFVYSPSQVPGLDVNADYFKIEIDNAVSTIGAQNIIDGCFINSSFCNLLTVTANQITDIRNVDTNVGSLLTEGIDVGLHYKFPSTPIGDFDARINGTFLKTYDVTTLNRATQSGFATSHLAGASEYPKRRFNGYLDWDYGNWSAQYHIEYYGATLDHCTVSIKGYCTYPNRTSDFQGTPGVFSFGRNHRGATVYHDVHVAYTVPSIHTTFGLGVNNLFDKRPPITGGGGVDLSVYRPPSRLVYGSIRVQF